MRIYPLFVAVLGLAAVPAAFAQGCCGDGTEAASGHAGCTMKSMTTPANHDHSAQTAGIVSSSPKAAKVFAEPVQLVYDNYITVQNALATDSLKNVSAAAIAMVKAVQGDPNQTLGSKVADQAQALAKAKDLAAARAAFKGLSESLIQHLSQQKTAAGVYHVAYCPMVKASWLQTSKTVLNPYKGLSMVHCGQLKS